MILTIMIFIAIWWVIGFVATECFWRFIAKEPPDWRLLAAGTVIGPISVIFLVWGIIFLWYIGPHGTGRRKKDENQ